MYLFNTSSISDEYFSDDEAYNSRSNKRVKRSKHKRRRRIRDDESISSMSSDESFDEEVPRKKRGKRKQKGADMISSLESLHSKKPFEESIRGSDIIHSEGSMLQDPEEIQRQIMEEVGKSQYAGTSAHGGMLPYG